MKLLRIYKSIIHENFKTQKARFMSQGIDPNIISTYFEKFKFIKNYRELKDEINGVSVVPERRGDIDAYKDFHELERVVDYVGGRRNVATSMENTPEVSGKPVYKDDNFEVYYADSPRACIKYRGSVPYSWCIARSDSSNMFYTYRFKPYEPAFYFIKDIKATQKEFKLFNMGKAVFKGSFSNKYHFFVLQVPKNINPEDNDRKQYIVSSANNDGDTQMSWSDILEINPKLNSIKGVLEPKPFSAEEKNQHKRFKNGIDDNEFRRLSYEDKRNYLDIYPTIGKSISYQQLTDLPDDLLNLYVSFGIGLDNDQHTYVKNSNPKAFKRYVNITHRKYDEYLKNSNYQRRQLALNYSELLTLNEDKVKNYLTTLSNKDINKLVSKNGHAAFEFIKKMFPEKFKKEDEGIINLLQSPKLNGDEFTQYVPEGVDVEYNSDFIFLDLSNIINDFWTDITVETDTQNLYDYGWEFDDYHFDYFDGWEEGIDEHYTNHLSNIIEAGGDVITLINSMGIKLTEEGLDSLLIDNNDQEAAKQIIKDENNTMYYDAYKEYSWELEKKAYNILELDKHDKTIKINKTALIMYIMGNTLFNTDKDEFLDNIGTLLENIYDDNDIPNEYYAIREDIENNAQLENVDESIQDQIEGLLYDSINNYIDLHSDDDDDDDGEYDSKLDKLKYEVIYLLNSTLENMGQKDNATEIDNEIVNIKIDRTSFKMNGRVLVKMTSKKTGNVEEGYIFIKDLPTYFTNYKLFETFYKYKNL